MDQALWPVAHLLIAFKILGKCGADNARLRADAVAVAVYKAEPERVEQVPRDDLDRTGGFLDP